jgi:transcriptional regulator with XRE-family HTH domain
MQAFSYISKNCLYSSKDMTTGRPASKPRTALGQRISEARQAAGLTQQELADKVNATQRVVAYWEREAVSLRADQIDALASALNVTADALLGRNKTTRNSGPVGKARRMFEEVSKLPRDRRRHVLRVVEDLLKANRSEPVTT